MGKLVFDTMRGIDFLLTRADIDPDRVGVAGNSLGGAKATWMLALEAQLKLGLVSGWGYGDHLMTHGKFCTRIPNQRLRAVCDWVEFVGLAAPDCAVLVMNGDADTIIDDREGRCFTLPGRTHRVLVRAGRRASALPRLQGRARMDPHPSGHTGVDTGADSGASNDQCGHLVRPKRDGAGKALRHHAPPARHDFAQPGAAVDKARRSRLPPRTRSRRPPIHIRRMARTHWMMSRVAAARSLRSRWDWPPGQVRIRYSDRWELVSDQEPKHRGKTAHQTPDNSNGAVSSLVFLESDLRPQPFQACRTFASDQPGLFRPWAIGSLRG
jgi:hypothetical protein